jgi:hypothetical protein
MKAIRAPRAHLELVWSSDSGNWDLPGLPFTRESFYEAACKIDAFSWQFSPDGRRCVLISNDATTDRWVLWLYEARDGSLRGFNLNPVGGSERAEWDRLLDTIMWHGSNCLTTIRHFGGVNFVQEWSLGESSDVAPERPLLPEWRFPGEPAYGQWRPQGDVLALSIGAGEGHPNGEVYLVEPGATPHRRLIYQVPSSHPRTLSWSRSGEVLAIITRENQPEREEAIYIWRPGMECARKIFSDRVLALSGAPRLGDNPVWSPDGRKLAISYIEFKMGPLPPKSPGILLVDSSTGLIKQLATGRRRYPMIHGNSGLFDWTATGRVRFLFLSGKNASENLWEVWEVDVTR